MRRPTRPIHSCAVAALVLLGAAPAWAATYFVSAAGGSDRNTCAQARSVATPRATITAGVACARSPGDVVSVAGNAVRYDEAPTGPPGQFSGLFLPYSGSAAGSITVTGRQNPDGSFDRPIWCVAGRDVPSDVPGGSNGILHTSGQSFVHVAHVEVCEHMDLGVVSGGLGGAGNVLIEDVVTNGRPGCCTQRNSSNPVSFVLVDGNATVAVHDVTIVNSWSKAPPASSGPCVSPCNPLNYSHVFVDHFNGVVIQNNQFDGGTTPFGGGILLKHFGQNLTVAKNFFSGMAQSCLSITQFADANPAVPSAVDTVTFSQNVCQGRLNDGGVSTADSQRGTTPLPFANFEWSNNTFYSDATGGKAASFQGVSSPGGAWKWYNNLLRFAANASQRYVFYGVDPVTPLNDFNSYSRTTGSDGPFWFREGAGSTCRNADGGCDIAHWRGMAWVNPGQPDGHSLVGVDPHLANPGGALVTDYRSTDPAGTGVYAAGRSDGTPAGTPAAVGAWLASTDVIGLLTGLQVTPPVRIDYGTQFIGGTPVDRPFTVQNLSDTAVAVTVSVPGGPFTVLTPMPLTVPAGQSGTVTVRFNPASAGTVTRTLAFASRLETATRTVTGVGQIRSTVQFGAASSAVVQGTTATIAVQRTGDTTGTTTVQFATSNGTALQPGDYTPAGGTLTFGVGQTLQTFTVVTSGGSPVATSKTLNLTLSSPSPASAGLGARRTTTLTLIGGPDLVLTSLAAPASGAAGQTITVPNTVTNQGGPASVAPPFRVAFFVSSTDSTPGAGVPVGSRSVASLAGNVNAAASTVLTIPANTPAGTYFLSAVADPDHVVSEWDETNNGATAPATLTITRPNLTVSSVTVPFAAAPGSAIAVPNTVDNTGSAAGPFTVGFFMSAPDGTPGAGVQIGSRSVASLAAGGSSAATTTLTVPASTPSGAYFVSAVADAGNAVAESDETNNGLTAPTRLFVGSQSMVLRLFGFGASTFRLGAGLEASYAGRVDLINGVVAPPGGLTVTITSDDPSTVLVASPIGWPRVPQASVAFTIPAGASVSPQFHFQALEGTRGRTLTLTATAPGYVPSRAPVAIVDPVVQLLQVPSSISAAGGPQFFNVYLGATAAGGGAIVNGQSLRYGSPFPVATFTVTSSDGTLLQTVTAGGQATTVTITMPQGHYMTPTVYADGPDRGIAVKGLAPGTATLTVSGTGYSTYPAFATGSVTITP